MVLNPENTDPIAAQLVDTGALVKSISRRPDDSLEPDGEIIRVEIKKTRRKVFGSFSADWILLERCDGRTFPTSEIVEICPEDELPSRGAKIHIYHCPVEIFNLRQMPVCGVIWTERDFALFSRNKHKIFIQNGLYKGSSGGMYTLPNGKVVAMHTDSSNSGLTVESVRAANPALTALECLTTASDSHAHAFASLAEGVILCKYRIARLL